MPNSLNWTPPLDPTMTFLILFTCSILATLSVVGALWVLSSIFRRFF